MFVFILILCILLVIIVFYFIEFNLFYIIVLKILKSCMKDVYIDFFYFNYIYVYKYIEFLYIRIFFKLIKLFR